MENLRRIHQSEEGTLTHGRGVLYLKSVDMTGIFIYNVFMHSSQYRNSGLETPPTGNMKRIGFISLLLIFGTLSVFGQTLNNSLIVLGSQHPNLKHEKPTSGVFVAQGLAAQNSEEIPDASTKQRDAADSENGKTTDEGHIQQKETRRIFKIINDYQLGEGEVLTTLVIIAADARLQGQVTGNVLVIGGDAQLSPEAQVNGTLYIIGGQITGNTQGVANLQVSNDWHLVPAAVHLAMHPHTFWGISKQANFRLTLIKLGCSVLMYLLIVAVFSNPINEISELFARRPIGSILFGILMLIAIPFLLVVLTLSIIGVPFMLLVLSLLIPFAICGKAAIFLTLGSTLFSGRWRPLAVIFGYILYFMATSVPYIDWAAFLIVNSIAIGLCLLSGISMIRSQEPRRSVSPLPSNEWGPR